MKTQTFRIVAAIFNVACIITVISIHLYFVSQIKVKQVSLPGFECPEGWRQIKGTNLIIDKRCDTLIINDDVVHRYSYYQMTKPQRKAARKMLQQTK